MRRIDTILVVVLVFLFTEITFSQFTNFKSKDGLIQATSLATAELKDPELFFLGIQTGDYTLSGINVTCSFDMASGKGTLWAYMFRSISKPDSIRFYGVGMVFGTYTGQAIDASLLQGKLPFTPTVAVAGKTYFDSDVMAQDISNNADYKTYIKSYPNAFLKLAGLAVDPAKSAVFWVTTFWSTGRSMNCTVNAVTGETVCTENTPVEDTKINEFSIYPNPASSLLVINLPSDFGSNDKFELYNYMGEKIRTVNPGDLTNTSQFVMDINSLPDGLYYINLLTNEGNFSKPVIIRK